MICHVRELWAKSLLSVVGLGSELPEHRIMVGDAMLLVNLCGWRRNRFMRVIGICLISFIWRSKYMIWGPQRPPLSWTYLSYMMGRQLSWAATCPRSILEEERRLRLASHGSRGNALWEGLEVKRKVSPGSHDFFKPVCTTKWPTVQVQLGRLF